MYFWLFAKDGVMTEFNHLIDTCRNVLISLAEIDPLDILPTTQFADLGLDSAKIVHFILEIEQETGLELTPGITDEHPTIFDFATYLHGRLAG